MNSDKNNKFVQLDRAYGFYRRALSTNTKTTQAEAKLNEAVSQFKAAFPGFENSMNDLSLIVGADILAKFLFRNRRGCLTLLFQNDAPVVVAAPVVPVVAAPVAAAPAEVATNSFSTSIGNMSWGDVVDDYSIPSVERAIQITKSIPKEPRSDNRVRNESRNESRLWKDSKKNVKSPAVGSNISSILKRVYSAPKLTESTTYASTVANTVVATTVVEPAVIAVGEPVRENLDFII